MIQAKPHTTSPSDPQVLGAGALWVWFSEYVAPTIIILLEDPSDVYRFSDQEDDGYAFPAALEDAYAYPACPGDTYVLPEAI
jgi:hypothetical protein